MIGKYTGNYARATGNCCSGHDAAWMTWAAGKVLFAHGHDPGCGPVTQLAPPHGTPTCHEVLP